MSESERRDQLIALLRETAKAHHEAFAASDGHDPEWPTWYAAHLQAPLRRFLTSELTVSRIVHTLVQLDDDHAAQESGLPWPEFWAAGILSRFSD